MTENPPKAAPESDAKPARAAKPKPGDVLQTSPGRYALVVGSEKAKHVHRGPDDQVTETVEREHPLVIDLPGGARRHEIDTIPL